MGAFFGLFTLILLISMIVGGLMLFHKLKKEKSIYLKIAAYLLVVTGVLGVIYTGYYAGKYCFSGSCPAPRGGYMMHGMMGHGMMMGQGGPGAPGMNHDMMMGMVTQCMQQMPKNKKMDARMMARMQACIQAQSAAPASDAKKE